MGIFEKAALKRAIIEVPALGGEAVEVVELSLKGRSRIMELYNSQNAALVPAAVAAMCVPDLADRTEEDIAAGMQPEVLQEIAAEVMALSGISDEDDSKN